MHKCPNCPYESKRAFDINRHLAKKNSCIPMNTMKCGEKNVDTNGKNVDSSIVGEKKVGTYPKMENTKKKHEYQYAT